jgi:hypothetical protein
MRAAARWLIAAAFFILVAGAANLRLYLKDGGYHLVREYQVLDDRVRYYSVERSDWEEIPLELVDLKRTEREAASRREAMEKEARLIATEEQAERAAEAEAARVPFEPGVYLVENGEVRAIPRAEAKAVSSTGRSILKRLVPYPIVAGKTTVEIDGERSANVVANPMQEFYFRLDLPEKFALFRLEVKKKSRVVQTWEILPLSDEVIEQEEAIPILHRQLADNLYKIWPTDPLKPGEYAVVEYTKGQRNIQIWDFSLRPAPKP